MNVKLLCGLEIFLDELLLPEGRIHENQLYQDAGEA